MRLVGITPQADQAERFVRFLKKSGTESLVRPEVNDFGIWVIEEDRLAGAKLDFQKFLENPHGSDFQISIDSPSVSEEDLGGMVGDHPSETESATGPEGAVGFIGAPPVWYPTTAFIAFAVVSVSVLTWFGEDKNELFRRLTFYPMVDDGTMVPFNPKDAWRTITPIFLHLNAIQLLFNLLMFQDLAGQIEQRLGRFRLILLILLFAIISNLAEGFLGPNRLFGGMSGLIFGLFGFVWMRAVYAPWTGFVMPPAMIWLLIAWFIMSLVNHTIPANNWGQAFGFCFGVLLGVFAPTSLKPREPVTAPESTPMP